MVWSWSWRSTSETTHGCGTSSHGIPTWSHGYETPSSYDGWDARARRSPSYCSLHWETQERGSQWSSSDCVRGEHNRESSGCNGEAPAHHLWSCHLLEASSGSNWETSGENNVSSLSNRPNQTVFFRLLVSVNTTILMLVSEQSDYSMHLLLLTRPWWSKLMQRQGRF